MQKYTSRHVQKEPMHASAKWGIFLIVLSVVLLFCVITGFLPFIRSFILGAIGVSVYPLILVGGIVGILLIRGKKYVVAKTYLFSLISLYFILLCVLQTVLTDLTPDSFGYYLASVYEAKITPGGVVAGVLSYGISALVNFAGALIIFGICAVVCVALMIDYYLKLKEYNKINTRAISYPVNTRSEEVIEIVSQNKKEKQVKEKDEIAELAKSVQSEGGEESLSDRIARKIFGSDYDTILNKAPEEMPEEEVLTINDYMNSAKENSFANFSKNHEPRGKKRESDDFFSYEPKISPSPLPSFVTQQKPVSGANVRQETFAADFKLEPLQPLNNTPKSIDKSSDPFGDISKIIDEVKPVGFNSGFAQNIKPKPKEEKLEQLEMYQAKPTTSPTTVYKRPSPYVRPPLSLLTTQSSKQEEDESVFRQNASILEETLESFKISATVETVVQGPAVTRYEIKMPAGVSVNRIKQHGDDIAMMMRSAGGVRIEAPIPGKNLVGVELPNKKIATIGLKDVFDSPEFHNTKSALPFALGKDIAGSIKTCDLSSMPHLLVAGSTGSGKSVCLNIIIVSLLYKMGPDDLKLILIDPKRVEFSSFNGLPHLCTPEAICQPKQALNAFDWAINEMDRRFEVFKQLKVRNFEEYNSLEAVYKGREPKLPRIVIIVDELADLMMFGKKELEDKIMRIAQLARAAGIHLVIATQRPSVDVITGTIKTNLPSRIAFSLNSYQDSMTIINQGGAEKLLGKGDMLYFPQNLPEPVRIQCPYLSNDEVKNIVDFIINNNEVEYDSKVVDVIYNGKGLSNGSGEGSSEGAGGGDGNEFDPILPKALFDFIKSGQASISAIQRRYAVGYARAARIVDQMEANGFVSPADGSNKRKVLIDEEKYNELFADGFMPEE